MDDDLESDRTGRLCLRHAREGVAVGSIGCAAGGEEITCVADGAQVDGLAGIWLDDLSKTSHELIGSSCCESPRAFPDVLH